MSTSNFRRRLLAATVLSFSLLASVAQASSLGQAAQDLDIPEGSLAAALQALAAQAHIQLLFSAPALSRFRAPRLHGRYTADQALKTLLDGSGVEAEHLSATVVVLRPKPIVTPTSGRAPEALPPQDPASSNPKTLDDARPGQSGPKDIAEVVVTGSHIRGAHSASPTVRLTPDDLHKAGDATVADALDRLTQNFSGQATPVSSILGSDRTYTNTAVSQGVNLRGLGASSTLVLINGRRLAGSGQLGDFTDVSAIPTAAVDHVDVLLDGASAIYGSDLTEDIITNCGVEVVFAPKALKVAQELSERLGAYTYAGRTFSRPSGLSSGRRSQTDSDQRRPLMLPQELIQLPSNALIVLRAGIAPIKGRKIVYYKERAFTARLRPPPKIPTRLNRPELLNSHRSSAFADARPEADAPAAPEPDPLVAHLDEEEILAWANHYVDRVLGSKAKESDRS